MNNHYVLMSNVNEIVAGGPTPKGTQRKDNLTLDEALAFAKNVKNDYLFVKIHRGKYPAQNLICYYQNGQLRNPDGTTKKLNN